MNIIIMVAQLLLSLTILVFVHELGHFLAAKLFKTKVEKFYLFFDFLFPLPSVLNFALWKKKIGDTEYGFGWFPLGGYVSIAGMVDETQDASQLSTEPQPWEYRSKKGWQKLVIILAGIIFNLIFAALIYSAILKVYNKEYLPVSELKNGGVLVSDNARKLGFQSGDNIVSVNGNQPERFEDLTPISILFGGQYEVERMVNGVKEKKIIQIPKDYYKNFEKDMFAPFYQNVTVDNVVVGSLAEKAGLKAKDKIIRVNKINITHFDLFRQILDSNKGKSIEIIVYRDSAEKVISASVGENGKLGFQPGFLTPPGKYKMQPYSIFQCIKYGVDECVKLFVLQAVSIGKIFTGEVKAKESVGGPVAMAKGFGVEWNWLRFWLFTAMISVGLAFMNLLPIPALDGGHAVVIIIEMIIRRPLSPKIMQILQNIGTFLILGLMVFAFYNDLTRK